MPNRGASAIFRLVSTVSGVPENRAAPPDRAQACGLERQRIEHICRSLAVLVEKSIRNPALRISPEIQFYPADKHCLHAVSVE